jgi:hypothetical protein
MKLWPGKLLGLRGFGKHDTEEQVFIGQQNHRHVWKIAYTIGLGIYIKVKVKKKVKLSLLQAMEAHRVERG